MNIDPALVTVDHASQISATRVKPDPPTDFVKFWRDTLAELNKIPLELTLSYEESPDASESGLRCGTWQATSLGARRISGPFVLPADVSPGCHMPQWVHGHGYGNVQARTSWLLGPARKGFLTLGLDARGYGRSRIAGDPGVPGLILQGIEDPHAYILRGAVADTIRATQVARTIGGASRPLVLTGASFSGGLSMLAAPWIQDLSYVAARVPTFGAYDLRRKLVEVGSGQEINELLQSLPAEEASRIRDNLRYFDAVNAATQLHSAPATVGFGVHDVCVPGETVAAIYNNLATPDKELLWYPCSHHRHPLATRWAEYEKHVLERAIKLVGLG